MVIKSPFQKNHPYKTRPWPNGQGLANFYSVLNDGLIARRRAPRGRTGYFLRAQFRSEARMFEHGMIYRASRRLADIKTLANMRGFIAPVEAAEGSFALLGFAYELHGCDGYIFGCVGAA